MRIYSCQLDTVWERPEENYRKVRALFPPGSVEPGSLVVLPEMFATGFSMNVEAVVEDGNCPPTVEFLQRLAVEHRIAVVGGLTRRGPDGRPRNEACVVFPNGTIQVRYAKMQLFSPAGETGCFVAGDAPVLFPWAGFQIAPFICYDLRFPELFRRASARGADCFLVLANWPDRRHRHWRVLLQARAIENQAFVIGVNRCGADPVLRYAGGSVLVDPCGQVLIEADGREQVLKANIEAVTAAEWRSKFPALRDRRDHG